MVKLLLLAAAAALVLVFAAKKIAAKMLQDDHYGGVSAQLLSAQREKTEELVRLSVKNGAAECRCVQGHQAELCLSPADAARLVFGHLPASLIAALPPYAAAWFPLPLSWDFMDFV
jgi:hypothetical protein